MDKTEHIIPSSGAQSMSSQCLPPLALKLKVFFEIYCEFTPSPLTTQLTFSPFKVIKKVHHLVCRPHRFFVTFIFSSMQYLFLAMFISGWKFGLFRNLKIVHGEMLTRTPRRINEVIGSPPFHKFPSGYCCFNSSL